MAVVWGPSIPRIVNPHDGHRLRPIPVRRRKCQRPGLTVASDESPLVSSSTTSESGWAVSTTVKVSVPPPSETVTAAPAEYKTRVVIVCIRDRNDLVRQRVPSVIGQRVVDGHGDRRGLIPSSRKSSTPVTVTACGVFHAAGEKVS